MSVEKQPLPENKNLTLDSKVKIIVFHSSFKDLYDNDLLETYKDGSVELTLKDVIKVFGKEITQKNELLPINPNIQLMDFIDVESSNEDTQSRFDIRDDRLRVTVNNTDTKEMSFEEFCSMFLENEELIITNIEAIQAPQEKNQSNIVEITNTIGKKAIAIC